MTSLTAQLIVVLPSTMSVGVRSPPKTNIHTMGIEMFFLCPSHEIKCRFYVIFEVPFYVLVKKTYLGVIILPKYKLCSVWGKTCEITTNINYYKEYLIILYYRYYHDKVVIIMTKFSLDWVSFKIITKTKSLYKVKVRVKNICSFDHKDHIETS